MAAINDGFNSLDNLLRMAEQAKNIGPRDLRQAVQVGMPKAERMAQKFLSVQYQKSGLSRRTGQLLNMLKRAKLQIIDPATSRVSLFLSMPSGMDKKDYVKASSLNYGAVRGGKDSALNERGATGRRLIGSKTLQKLKSRAQVMKSGTFQKISSNLGVSGEVGKTKAGSTTLNTTAGSATVTKAHRFFFLTDKQISEIKGVIFGSAMEYLQAKITGKRSVRKAA